MDAFQSSEPFQKYLFTNERILWTGQPMQGLTLRRRDAVLIPASILLGGCYIFMVIKLWSLTRPTDDVDWLIGLFSLLFLGHGLYICLGRFFYDAWVRKRLFYAVTSDRVLILRGRPTTKFTPLDIRSLPILQLKEDDDGTGTITFDSSSLGYGMRFASRAGPGGYWTPSRNPNPQFLWIDNPRRVYELIRNQAQS